MVPFYILLGAVLLLRGLGLAGLPRFRSLAACVRTALAIVFTFTGATHFTAMAHDYAAMLPESVPARMELVYVTGALEIAGAVGLLVPGVSRAAGVGLMLLLVAVFPANVYASLEGIPFRGAEPTPLWLRGSIQLVYLGALWFAVVRGRGGSGRSSQG